MKKIIFNKHNIKRVYKHGVESTIYFYKNESQVVFLKIFKREINFSDHKTIISDEAINNKRRKIELVPEIEEFNDEIKVLDLVYDECNNFIGYTMEIDELKTAKDISKTKLKIEILKQVKEKIEMFNEVGIYIGDFNPENIIITNKGIKLCDLDNFRIDDLDFDLKSYFQKTYLNRCANIKNIDNYSFNLFTICYLGNIFEPYIWMNIKLNGLPRKLNTKQNRIITSQLFDINDNYEKQYLIDNIRKIA